MAVDKKLDSFDPDVRRGALKRIYRENADQLPPAGTDVNMHMHSFFSYNAFGWSPSHLTWEARTRGLYAAAVCDFDVVDAQEEFLDAALLLGLRAAVHLETRVFAEEYADVDISSPGEPGVMYMMAAGFSRPPEPGPPADGLHALKERAGRRNMGLVERLNSHLPDIPLDYEADVLPLTPAGTATERHIVRAYLHKSTAVFPEKEALVKFWSGILGESVERVAALLDDGPSIETAIRSRLVKRGGLGYREPTPETFPRVEEFIEWTLACGAIPMVAWLDGTSEGEKDTRGFLECLAEKGAQAVNIIPDRNWNIADPAERKAKQARLHEFLRECSRMSFPVNIGTEMNKAGLPFADNLDVEPLSAYKTTFLQGAAFFVGHTILSRVANFSYVGEPAQAEFENRALRNAFFSAVGQLPPMTRETVEELLEIGPMRAFERLSDEVRRSDRERK